MVMTGDLKNVTSDKSYNGKIEARFPMLKKGHSVLALWVSLQSYVWLLASEKKNKDIQGISTGLINSEQGKITQTNCVNVRRVHL